jgi:NADPH:quinone reductase-like Zn-dependent oxidoreductase
MHFDGEQKGADFLKVCEAPIPQPSDNEVLIKVTASSVNRIDLM